MSSWGGLETWFLGKARCINHFFNKFSRTLHEEQSTTTHNDIAKTILMKVKSTLSDRAAMQIKFNDLIERYRQDILPLCC